MEAEWSRDGRFLYYGARGRVMKVSFDPATGELGTPQRVIALGSMLGLTLSPDGGFLASRIGKSSERHAIKVVLNWTSTLEGKN